MSHSSAPRILTIIVLIISLSGIMITAVYFYSNDNASGQIISQLPLPVKINSLTPPDANRALTTLFTIVTTDNKLKIGKNTLASLWFQQSFNDGINKYHVVFIKNQSVDLETNEVYGSHADAPIISAVVYKLVKDEWILASKQKNIGVFGSWGDTPNIKQADVLPLAKGNTALLLTISYSGQGYTNSGQTIFAYHQNNWAQLGYLQTEGDNAGVCDNEVKEDELLSACWSFKGKISLAKNDNVSDYPDIIVHRTGTMGGENAKIIPVKNSLYRFNGEKYLEISEVKN